MVVPYSTSNAAGIDFRTAVTPTTTGYAQDVTGLAPTMPLGTIAHGTDGSVWVQCLVGVGGVTGLGFVVVIDEDFGCVMMSNSVGGLGDAVGVAPVLAAAGDYIWVQRFGTCDALQVLASANPNVPLASTVTAGALDDAVATPTKNITGVVLTTARAASQGNAPAYLNWPVVGTTN